MKNQICTYLQIPIKKYLKNSLIGHLRRPLARPSGLGGIKVVELLKMH